MRGTPVAIILLHQTYDNLIFEDLELELYLVRAQPFNIL